MKFVLFFLTLLQTSDLSSSLASPKVSLYDESIRMLWASTLVYDFATILQAERTNQIRLEYPPEISSQLLEKYENESLDFRGMVDVGDGPGGMPFSTIADTFTSNSNKKQIAKLLGEEESRYLDNIISKIKTDAEEDYMAASTFTLETFRSLKQNVSCVYGVVKDRKNKRIIVVFRGTNPLGEKDWTQNFKFFMRKMKTPKLIRDKMEGSLKRNLIVHQGFFEYLFDNPLLDEDDSKQRYKSILNDIKDLVEDGYKIYVTGHSLGAALSSLTSLKLAGSKKKWIPRPITCISFASPFNGGNELRSVFQKLEEDEKVRYLRVVNDEDIVPTGLPLFLALKFEPTKHVGVHLRLMDGDKLPEISHPTTHNEFIAAIKNNVLSKIVAFFVKFAKEDVTLFPPSINYSPHSPLLFEKRLNRHADYLQKKNLDDIYNDPKIVRVDDGGVVE